MNARQTPASGQEPAALEKQYVALVEEHDAPLRDLKDQFALLDAVRRRLDEAKTVDMGTSTCPRNRYYEHRRYCFQWYDADADEVHKTRATNLCTSGLCHHHIDADTELWQATSEIWQQWAELHSRLLITLDNASALRQRLTDLEERIASRRGALAASRGTQFAPLPRPLEFEPRYTTPWEKPDQPDQNAVAARVTDAKKARLKKRIIEAIRDNRLPDDQIVQFGDGTTYLQGEEATRYTGITQLLSEEHRRDADIWIEILRKHPNQIQHVPEVVRDDRRYFLWMLREADDLIRDALPSGSTRVRSDVDLMIEIMQLDWALVEQCATEELRNDPKIAVEALRRFDKDVHQIVQWFGPTPKDTAEVMSAVALIAPSAIRYATERLRNDRDFARQILSSSLELYNQAHPTREDSLAEAKKRDWRIAKRIAQEARAGTPIDYGQPQDSWETLDNILLHLGDAPKDDEDAMLPALLEDGRAMQHLSKRLRSDKPFLLRAMGAARERFGAEHAAEVCVRISRELPEHLRDDEDIALRAVEVCSGQAIMNCWSEQLHVDKEFVLKALSRSIYRRRILVDLPEELRDDEKVVLQALAGDGSAILAASERLRTHRRFLKRALAASVDPNVLNELERLMRDYYDETDPETGESIDHRLNAANHLIIQAASLPSEVRDDDEVILATLETASSLEGVSERLRNAPKFAKRAVEIFGRKAALDTTGEMFCERIMEELGKNACDDESVMLAAVEVEGLAIKYASLRLKTDPSFAAQALAVSQNARTTLRNLPASVRDNETVMLAAARVDPLAAVQLASERLRWNRRFAETAVEAASDPEEVVRFLDLPIRQLAPAADSVSDTRAETIRLVDVVIVALVAVFCLAIGFAFYANPRITVLVLVALGVIGAVAGLGTALLNRSDSAYEAPETPRDEPDTATREEGSVQYDRKGQIELAERIAKHYLDDVSKS